MSWSISFIGTPEKVSNALSKHSEAISGASKAEYDAALPHLKGIVDLNFNKTNPPTLIKMSASGSGIHTSEGQVQGSCKVNIEEMWGMLV